MLSISERNLLCAAESMEFSRNIEILCGGGSRRVGWFTERSGRVVALPIYSVAIFAFVRLR